MHLLKKIFESDLFDTLLDKEMTRPEYLLHPPEAGFTDHWFFNAETKQLERFSRNKTVFVLSSYDKEKYLFFTSDGRENIGKLDIFLAQLIIENRWKVFLSKLMVFDFW